MLELPNEDIVQFAVSINQQLSFSKSLVLENISYRYTKNLPWTFHNLNLEILHGDRIGIIGETGCGKSTLLDILMTMLLPERGKMIVDGINITEPGRPDLIQWWRSCISTVSQRINLLDATFAENIAFGKTENEIDMDRVIYAAKQAQINGFIESTTNGYQNRIGEDGIRLSGGQIQRIGIARALYKKASLLILDEATSALDTETERAFMSSIDQLSAGMTVVTVAHRLTTLAGCNAVYKIVPGGALKLTRKDDLFG
jgi:ATP-binding cassette subfamily B protein